MRRNQVLIGAIVGVAVFYTLGLILLGTPPDATDSGAQVVRWFREHAHDVRVAVWFTTFAMVFFGVFAAYVRQALPKPHADIFFAGAITLIAETIVQTWIFAGLALHPRSLQPSSARLAFDIVSFWGPVLISATILMLAPVVVLAFRGEAGLPRWLGWLAGIALAEQIVESITIFGTRGFTAPGGPMNLELGAGLTTIALLAIGVVVATKPEPGATVTLFDPAHRPSAPPARPKVKLVVAYDGTDFSGFAPQPAEAGVRTVGGLLREAIAKVLRHDVDLTCVGRTDAGVHAWGQVVSFAADGEPDLVRLQQAVNSMLGPEVVVRSCELVDPRFDARHGARWRQYRYSILNRPVTDPFRDRFVWWVPEPLDLRALRLAADPFVGEHDFSAFCRKGPEGSSLTRLVFESRWVDEGDGALRYEIRANAFCWQMVRAVVGTLVEVGIGKRRPGDMMGVIRKGDRRDANQLAPPRGLCLWDVGY